MNHEMEKMLNTLKDLVSIEGPSGYEQRVAEYMKSRMETKCEEITKDRLGNLICRLNSFPSGPKVAVFAHMDEIGLVVRKIEEDGFIRMVRLGGIEEKVLPGKKVLVMTEGGKWIEGAIGVKSHHLTKPDEKYVVTKVEDLYIDIGAESAEDAVQMGIKVGNPIVFSREFSVRGYRVMANAIDNRGGCSVLLEVIDDIDPLKLHSEVYLIGSTQEEFSLRGILPAIRSVKPDILICLDVAPSCDTPDLKNYTDLKLGAGAVVNLYTFHGRGTLAGLIPSREFVKWIESTAESNGIPLQRNVFFGGLTDVSFAQLELKGMLSVDLGFPSRYTHSTIEVCDVRDLISLKSLVLNLLYRFRQDAIEKLE